MGAGAERAGRPARPSALPFAADRDRYRGARASRRAAPDRPGSRPAGACELDAAGADEHDAGHGPPLAPDQGRAEVRTSVPCSIVASAVTANDEGRTTGMTLRIGTLRGLDACASETGHVVGPRARPSQQPAPHARPGRPGRSHATTSWSTSKRAVVRALWAIASGRPARPRARGRAGRRGRLAAGRGRAHRGRRGQRLRRPSHAPGRARCWRAGASRRPSAWAPTPSSCSSTTTPTQPPPPTRSSCSFRSPRIAPTRTSPLFLETAELLDRRGRHGPDRRGAARRRHPHGPSAYRPSAATCSSAEFPYDASVTDRARWAEACEELDEASSIPWVLLSGGVDDATFEAQTEAACRAGASGRAGGSLGLGRRA